MRKIAGVAIAALLAVGVLAGGCGGSKSGGSATGGGVINISLHQDPPKLDPSVSSAFVERHVFQSIFDKLMDINENGDIVPMLADKWTISPDGLKYTLNLHKGVKFHDGTDFNAEAVKFNLEQYMDKKSNRRGELKEIAAVKVIDPNTVEITLKHQFAPLLSILTDRAGMMRSPAAVKKYGDDFMNHPIGTGPYIFKERVKGSTITLVKNDKYWGSTKPKLAKLVYKIIDDTNVALVNLKSGQVDITNRFPLNEIPNFKSDVKIAVSNDPGPGFKGFALNTNNPKFKDARVRKALELLVDRDIIAKVALHGVGTPGRTALPPKSFAYDPIDKAQKPDVEKAKALLKEAGVSNLNFKFIIDTEPVTQQVGQLLQKMFKAGGVELTLEKTEFGTLLDKARKGNFEALMVSWSGRVDPDQNIFDWMTIDGKQNYMRYNNQELTDLLNKARVSTKQEERKAIYKTVMTKILEASPYIYLYHEHNVFGVSKAVKGFKNYPDGMIRTLNLEK